MWLAGRTTPATEESAVHGWDGRLLGSVARDGVKQVDEAVEAVAGGVGALPPEGRAAVLESAAAALEADVDGFSTLITAETGVCVRETRREVARAAANLRVAAAEAVRLRGESIPVPGHRRLAVTLREPVGVVAGITPFNRPLNQVAVKVAPAVAAGCPVVVKPSERAPLTALRFAALMAAAGLPDHALAVLTGAPAEIGSALAGHPDVAMVTFTGSVTTGHRVAALAAGKRHLLELGGNDPLLVLPDADLDLAARLAADGACATAGQSCRGVKRIVVWEEVADAFLPRLADAVAAKRQGDPTDPATDLGPLVDDAAAALVERRVSDAVERGASLVSGGGRRGAWMAPTVLDHVPPDAELVADETFGPVAPVLRVTDADHAVAVVNSTGYGLQAGVVTGDVAAFTDLAARLRVGAVNLGEGPQFDSPYIPFGGVGRSGVGREGIRYAVEEMTAVKTLTLPWPT